VRGAGGFAVVVRFDQGFALCFGHAPCGQAATHGFEFGHEFKHFNQARGANAGNHCAFAWANVDQAFGGKLNHGFAGRRA
jgi:hypothetical protein